MTPADEAKFKRLVNDTSSADGGTRVLARLKLNKFVIMHGDAECKAVFNKMRAVKGKKK